MLVASSLLPVLLSIASSAENISANASTERRTPVAHLLGNASHFSDSSDQAAANISASRHDASSAVNGSATTAGTSRVQRILNSAWFHRVVSSIRQLRASCTMVLLAARSTFGRHAAAAIALMHSASKLAADEISSAYASARSWLKVAAANALEDLQVAAAQYLGSLVDASQEAALSAMRTCRAYLRRSRSVSRILQCARRKHWYSLLQVRRRATKRQLKDAYRRLAKRVHPDKTRDGRAEQGVNAP